MASLVSLKEVDIRADLLTRPYRAPNYEGETRALALLARELAANPRNMLQRLVETALELCQADTAGISILEGDVFRWEALAGVFAGYRDNTMPRHASPCGVCIDENVAQLMHLPDRCFPALLTEPRFVEALLIPFHAHGKPIGTVWIVTHNFERKFDREDERIVSMLSQFASAGWQLWKVRDTGVGILEGQLQGIFEMFTQGSGGQEDTAGGLGLGLMLVRSIAEMHGGTAEAKSEGPGKGSQFIVRLPTVQGPGVAVKRSERADAHVFRQIP